jgi:hypothetical protein
MITWTLSNFGGTDSIQISTVNAPTIEFEEVYVYAEPGRSNWVAGSHKTSPLHLLEDDCAAVQEFVIRNEYHGFQLVQTTGEYPFHIELAYLMADGTQISFNSASMTRFPKK